MVDDETYKADFISKFDLVRKRKIQYNIPVALIFDPNAGKANDILPLIQDCLYNAKIRTEVFHCESHLDAYNFAKDLEITNYSVLVAIGDDGTFHEAANGMLSRVDNKRIPFSIIPNGNESDLCKSIGIESME